MSISAQTRFCGIAALLLATPAAAQDGESGAQDSAATAAEDAFGASVGINQVGLYSPYQTRGFDLVSTGGSFRIDGFYFHPAALPSESTIPTCRCSPTRACGTTRPSGSWRRPTASSWAPR